MKEESRGYRNKQYMADHVADPFMIQMVETIKMTTSEERKGCIKPFGIHLFSDNSVRFLNPLNGMEE